MANQEHVEMLWKGAEIWNQWRKEHPDIQPDLSRADLNAIKLSRAPHHWVRINSVDLSNTNLSGTDLSGTDLSRANLMWSNLSPTKLREANLSDANLRFTNFFTADLNRANLSKARLDGADLGQANLSEAKFDEAHLSGANLYKAKLHNTDLSNAVISHTIFADVDLSLVQGLETIVHAGPSEISISTIYRSKGHIPEDFLRKAGVPDSFITYMRSLVVQPVDYYTCFISYSNHDEAFAKRLYADLQQKGVRCWFAPHDMRIGDKIRPRIDESIRLYDKLLLVLSEYSARSQWVEQEVETALAKEREGKSLMLFPIRLDETIMQLAGGWPALIRNTRHIGDFTKWKQDDDYQQALERLLRDLKAET